MMGKSRYKLYLFLFNFSWAICPEMTSLVPSEDLWYNWTQLYNRYEGMYYVILVLYIFNHIFL